MRWRLLIIGFILLFTVGCGFGLLDMEKESIPPLKKQTIHIQNSSLEIDLPFELKDIEVPESEQIKQYIYHYVAKAGGNDDFWVEISGACYNRAKIEVDTGKPFVPDLDNSLSMGIDNMAKASSRIKEAKIEERKNITLNGMSGRQIDGSIIYKKRNNTTIIPASHFRGVAFSKNDNMWSVLVCCQKNDSVGEKLIDLVTNSIIVK